MVIHIVDAMYGRLEEDDGSSKHCPSDTPHGNAIDCTASNRYY